MGCDRRRAADGRRQNGGGDIEQIADQTPLEFAQALKQLAGAHWGRAFAEGTWHRSRSSGAASLRTATRNQAEGQRGCRQITANSPRISDPAGNEPCPLAQNDRRAATDDHGDAARCNTATAPMVATTPSPRCRPGAPGAAGTASATSRSTTADQHGANAPGATLHWGFPVWWGHRTPQRPRHRRS